MSGSGAPRPAILLVIALATPAALAIETLLRTIFLPADLEQIRQDLRPTLTPFAWGILALTAIAVPIGFAAKRALERRFLARIEAQGGGEKKRDEAMFEAMFVATSIPQIPAIFATFAFTAGAHPAPVIACVTLSAAAVIAIALRRGRENNSS